MIGVRAVSGSEAPATFVGVIRSIQIANNPLDTVPISFRCARKKRRYLVSCEKSGTIYLRELDTSSFHQVVQMFEQFKGLNFVRTRNRIIKNWLQVAPVKILCPLRASH